MRCQPKLEKILSLLEPSSFKGIAYEKQIDPEYLHDWRRLRRNIQSSDHELEEALTKYSVAVIDGNIYSSCLFLASGNITVFYLLF